VIFITKNDNDIIHNGLERLLQYVTIYQSKKSEIYINNLVVDYTKRINELLKFNIPINRIVDKVTKEYIKNVTYGTYDCIKYYKY